MDISGVGAGDGNVGGALNNTDGYVVNISLKLAAIY